MKRWTDQEIATLRKTWPLGGNVAQAALPHRTRHAMATKAKELRLLVDSRSWSAEEDLLLREIYASATERELLDAFPGRTIKACVRRASRLDVRRPRQQPHQTPKRPEAAPLPKPAIHTIVQTDEDPFCAPISQQVLSNWKVDHPIGARSVFDLAGVA